MPEYVVISNLGVEREKTTPHRNDHLDYLSKLKKMGNLETNKIIEQKQFKKYMSKIKLNMQLRNKS